MAQTVHRLRWPIVFGILVVATWLVALALSGSIEIRIPDLSMATADLAGFLGVSIPTAYAYLIGIQVAFLTGQWWVIAIALGVGFAFARELLYRFQCCGWAAAAGL